MNNILVDLNFVSFSNHSVELTGNFVLTSSGYFVVVCFYNQTHFFHNHTHCSTQIVCRVYWWNREVTAFNAWTVTHVTVSEF